MEDVRSTQKESGFRSSNHGLPEISNSRSADANAK